MDRAAIEHLYDYTGWAWRQLAGEIAKAGDKAFLRPVPGSGWPALRDCLAHYLFAYDRWLSVLLHRPAFGIEPAAFGTLAEVDARRDSFRDEFRTLLDGLSDDELAQIRDFSIDDVAMPYSYGELLAHVLLHERGHHGDITTLMYQQGIGIPLLDYRFHLGRTPRG